MNCVKILFFKTPSSFFDRVVRWWTHSKYSHCEILFEDGQMYSADGWNSKCVRYTTNYNLNNWDIITLPVDATKIKYMRDWCDSKVGQKYDWMGILRFIIPILPRIENKWFCSELCGAALKYINVLDWGVDVSGLSPQGLYILLLKYSTQKAHSI